ncbi:MAG: DUF6552 family protein [Paracoccaceae bacterium]
MQTVDHVKWLATAVQLVGYDSTKTGITLWNIYFLPVFRFASQWL